MKSFNRFPDGAVEVPTFVPGRIVGGKN